MLRRLLVLLLLACPTMASGQVQTREIEYEHDGVKFVGFLAWNDQQQPQPGILVVHEWWGLNDYARQRATQLAELGYVAMAVDMYGEGKVTQHPQQAGQWAAQVRQNIAQWRERAFAGLEILRTQPQVDPQRLAAIGYCFGGATVVQLAYAGAPVRGVVSFHGSLPLPEEGVEQIEPRILICHGAADPFIPAEQTQNFRTALSERNADWQMIYYSQAQHSFTNPAADAHQIQGIKYNEQADKDSWQHMQLFLDSLFAD